MKEERVVEAKLYGDAALVDGGAEVETRSI